MPTDIYQPFSAMQALQPDGTPIELNIQVEMKISTLDKQAQTGCKFNNLTQNLISLPVIAYNRCNIKLDKKNINVSIIGNPLIKGFR